MSDNPVPLPPGVRLLHPDSVPDRNGVAATLSHTTRDGEWVLPRHFRALAMLGGIDLDLTQVVLGEEESEIEAVAILGNISIIVPQGIRVECEGDATFGTFDLKRGDSARAPAGAPVIRVTGSAFMGSVSVRIEGPSGSRWMDRFLNR